MDDWSKAEKKVFCFYGKKFNIILRECDGDVHKIVCAQGNDVCVAAQFKTIWFVACGQKKKMKMEKKKEKGASKEKQPAGFSGAQQAYNKIMKDVWDALEEAGV